MKYIITESQYEKMKKMVFDYLDSYDWEVSDEGYEYADLTRLYVRGKNEHPSDAMFEGYNIDADDEDETEEGRMLLVRPIIWDTVSRLFGFNFNHIGTLFLEWYNNFTGENCTTVDRM